MSYNFLGLVNDVNRRLNEVELTQSNFDSAIGFYASAKDSVNSAIRKINQEQFEWPFNHVTQEDTLSAGTNRYAFQPDMKTVDMDSFRIKRDDSLGVETKNLKVKTYEDYLKHYIDSEYNTNQTSAPDFVIETPKMEYALYPNPDKAYTLVYEYYSIPAELSAHDDVPTIPSQYRYVIVEGAMYYAYMFRGDLNSAQLTNQNFMEGIKDMKTLLINRYEYISSTVRRHAH